MPSTDPKDLDFILNRGISQIIIVDELRALLQEGRPLRLKMGFDPSRPDIHLGHVVGLRKLRQLQELGHDLVLIVGDWTAQIGDPSGSSVTRPMLTADEVKLNAQSYMKQFFKIVDPDKTRAVYQSEWFGDFTLDNVIKLTSMFTVNQFLHREDFSNRYNAGKPIAITEMLYPLLQAYDSIAIDSEVEFGGTDQMFNLLVGRELQEKMGKRPQQCVMMPILPGTDGARKMSKSFDNYIGVEESPTEMFGKIMSLPDTLIMTYLELLTDIPDHELTEIRVGLESNSIHPMDMKKHLSREIVNMFHDPNAAAQAQAEFELVFQKKELPVDSPQFEITPSAEGVISLDEDSVVVDLGRFLPGAKLASSRAETKRLLAQGAVEIDGQKIGEEKIRIHYGTSIKVGKRKFLRIVKP